MAGATREIVSAARDLLGIVRVLLAAERNPEAAAQIAGAEYVIADAMNLFAVAEPSSPEYDGAALTLRDAVQAVRATLSPERTAVELLGTAAKRLRELQGRDW